MPADTLKPSDNAHWPSWFYPPTTDPENATEHGRVFQRAEDVPEGWLVHWEQHGDALRPVEPAVAAEIPFTRRELQAELTKRDIPFTPQTGRAELWALLQVAAEDEDLDTRV